MLNYPYTNYTFSDPTDSYLTRAYQKVRPPRTLNTSISAPSLEYTPPKQKDFLPDYSKKILGNTENLIASQTGQPGGGLKSLSNPSNLWSSRTSNVVGAVADIGTSLFLNNSRVADQSNTTKTLNTTYDTTSSALMSSGNPYAMMAGAIMKGAGLASDALTAAGVGTDQMTGIDKVLDSKWLKLTPPGLINALGASSTLKFAKDAELQELLGDAYADTYGDIDSAAAHAGKKYGLFSKHSKKKWDSKINYARLNLNNIEGINETNQDAIAAGNYEGLAIGNLNALNGGVQMLRVGKNGMKFDNLIWAKDIIKAQKGLTLNRFSPVLPYNFKLKDFNLLDFPGLFNNDLLNITLKTEGEVKENKNTADDSDDSEDGIIPNQEIETENTNRFKDLDLRIDPSEIPEITTVITSPEPERPVRTETPSVVTEIPPVSENPNTVPLINSDSILKVGENIVTPIPQEPFELYQEFLTDHFGEIEELFDTGEGYFNANKFIDTLKQADPNSVASVFYKILQKQAAYKNITEEKAALHVWEKLGPVGKAMHYNEFIPNTSEVNVTSLKLGGTTPEKKKISYEEWVKDVNPDFISENYDLKTAYEHLDSNLLDRWKKAVNSKIRDEKNPLSIDYKDPKTGEYINHLLSVLPLENGDYIFLKLGNVNTNSELIPEIEWYNSGEGQFRDTYDLVFEPSENRYYYRKKYSKGGNLESPQFLKEGGSFNVIPEGALHKNKHNMDNAEGLTKKGIPVVTEEDGKLVQLAEIERDEIIFRLEVTKKLEELKLKQEEAESEEEKAKIAIEAGKLLVKEILHNTEDNTGLIEQVE